MKITLCLISFFLTRTLFSQQAAQPVRLADCISQALGKNPALQISQAKVQSAEARSSEALTSLLPQLKFTGRAAELSPIDPFGIKIGPPVNLSMILFPSITENYSMKLSLQQPLFTGFKLKKNLEMAELNASAAKEELTRDQEDLVLNVITAYWNFYRAIKVEEVIRQSLDQMSEHLKDARNLLQQGMATDADVMKVQVQLSDVNVKYLEARNAIRLTSMALNSLMRNSLETEIMPSDTPAISQSAAGALLDQNLSSLQTLALARRPELKSMQLRRDMGTAGVSAAKGGWYPQIFLAADYDYARPNQRIIPPKDQWDGTWDVGVTLQWNIWDWYATGHQTAQAEAALRQSEAGIVQLNDAVTLDVAQQYFNAQTAKDKVEVAFEGMEQAQESYRMTSEKYKNGVTSNTEMLDAEIALLQARLTHTQAIVDCTLALARLKKAVGENL
ncbi:MAG: TolC family protein [Bacteroidota bacterium]|jgi:outer membrane protein TolC